MHTIVSCTTIPVARSSSPSSLTAGNPQPGLWAAGWGHRSWSTGLSGVLALVASATNTLRPSHSLASCMPLQQPPHRPSTTPATAATGRRARASQ
ncbi:MAG TPA: hypothetical protein VG269_25515 [Tepidisphaeraceae bacterium]|jgi:hypothetical protein|nr:hypothetical protein [Tepidisphaeraceae bacterium]